MGTLVMGVLNVTPDSFSDGGRFTDPVTAIEAGRQMRSEGADIIDVGGESTRPGAPGVSAEEECRRVRPVVAALAVDGRVSIDTRKAEVAEVAVAAGATLINDVSASLAPVAAAAGVGWVAMHMQGEPATMQRAPHYDDVVAEVATFLADRAARAHGLGVEEVWIDPGIGFGKTPAHNLALLAHLEELVCLGYPVMVGTSRKSFLAQVASRPPSRPQSVEGSGDVMAEPTRRIADHAPAGPQDRLEGSLATAVWAATKGVRLVRVHDVASTVAALRLLAEPVDHLGSTGLIGTVRSSTGVSLAASR
ncbi:MAG: dihydropteroate synthase [Acidimicrobiales bacterium]